jgi:hypothetical protein
MKLTEYTDVAWSATGSTRPCGEALREDGSWSERRGETILEPGAILPAFWP